MARIVEVQHAIDLLAAHGRSTRGAAVPLAVALALTFAALVQPGSQAVAQAVEVEDREEGPKKRTGASRPTPPEGQVYTWKDGGRSSRAFLQADLVVSRSGANSLCELLTLRKPNLLVPLPALASRGDQIENAAYAESAGFSMVVAEAALTPDVLVDRVTDLHRNSPSWRERLEAFQAPDSAELIIAELEAALKRRPKR